MTVSDPLAHWPDRTRLRGRPDGAILLVYTPGDSHYAGLRWADGAWRPPSTVPEDVAAAVAAQLAEWALSTDDPALVDALQGRGARPLRHAHSMSLDLTSEPLLAHVPDGVSLRTLTADMLRGRADDIGALARRAHGEDGQGWPDDDAAAASMRRTAAGQVLGPLLDSSVLAERGEQAIGACLVVDRPGDPPHGGPWVVDVVRDPDDPARGIGAAMLAQAARGLRSAGLGALSLAVTDDNTTARAVYDRLGFADLTQSWTLALPVAVRNTRRSAR